MSEILLRISSYLRAVGGGVALSQPAACRACAHHVAPRTVGEHGGEQRVVVVFDAYAVTDLWDGCDDAAAAAAVAAAVAAAAAAAVAVDNCGDNGDDDAVVVAAVVVVVINSKLQLTRLIPSASPSTIAAHSSAYMRTKCDGSSLSQSRVTPQPRRSQTASHLYSPWSSSTSCGMVGWSGRGRTSTLPG